MLASCAVDKTVTIWDSYNAAEKITSGPPKPCGNKDMKVGKLYAINFYPSSPWLLGTAGNGSELALWDMTRDANIQKRFGDRVSGTNSAAAGTAGETKDATSKKEAFDAMMSGENNEEDSKPVEMGTKSKLKKKNKKKKKAHRAGR